MQRLRSVKISVEVDTNKTTYKKEFDDVDDMLVWLKSLDLGICQTVCPVDPPSALADGDNSENSAGN